MYVQTLQAIEASTMAPFVDSDLIDRQCLTPVSGVQRLLEQVMVFGSENFHVLFRLGG